MGPREALEQIAAIVKTGIATDDLPAVHGLLRHIQSITENAIGHGTLRRARLLRARQSHSESRSSQASA